MSKKHFSWLLVLTIIIAAVIFLMPGKTGHESEFAVRPLIPGSETWVNDVAKVRIVKAGNQTVATLSRGEQGWRVEESQSYPADWARLKGMLAALAQAQVIEPKTTNPAYFDRLGLTDVADAASSGVMVAIGEGDKAITLLIGHAAQGRQGHYVRFADDDQALLIDRTVEVATETRDWLDRSIVDLKEAEVVEVTITHADGEQVSVRKNSADDQNFTLQGLPKGREIQSSWGVNALGASLSELVLDEVVADSQIDWTQAARVRVLTADGLEIAAELVKSGEKTWLRLTAAAYAPEQKAEQKAEQKVTQEDQKKQDGETVEESATAELGKRVESINRRVGGWAYAIPDYKSEVMSKRLEDLLKPLKKD